MVEAAGCSGGLDSFGSREFTMSSVKYDSQSLLLVWLTAHDVCNLWVRGAGWSEVVAQEVGTRTCRKCGSHRIDRRLIHSAQDNAEEEQRTGEPCPAMASCSPIWPCDTRVCQKDDRKCPQISSIDILVGEDDGVGGQAHGNRQLVPTRQQRATAY